MKQDVEDRLGFAAGACLVALGFLAFALAFDTPFGRFLKWMIGK